MTFVRLNLSSPQTIIGPGCTLYNSYKWHQIEAKSVHINKHERNHAPVRRGFTHTQHGICVYFETQMRMLSCRGIPWQAAHWESQSILCLISKTTVTSLTLYRITCLLSRAFSNSFKKESRDWRWRTNDAFAAFIIRSAEWRHGRSRDETTDKV